MPEDHRTATPAAAAVWERLHSTEPGRYDGIDASEGFHMPHDEDGEIMRAFRAVFGR